MSSTTATNQEPSTLGHNSADLAEGTPTGNWRSDIVCLTFVVLVTCVIGGLDLGNSGEIWLEDGPRYCNNGAMVHDWIVSGDWRHPIDFARQNYIKYPAHSIPYHPPGYAFLLGVWFTLTGMQYTTARLFVVLCAVAVTISFYVTLRRQQIVPVAALSATLLLVTSPEVSRWMRSMMSEIPALSVILIASYFFLRFVKTERPFYCWGAFILAGVAFFFRVSTAGVLPAWIFYFVSVKGIRRTVSPHILIPSALYLVTGATWVRFVSQLAVYEIRASLTDRMTTFLTWENLSQWLVGLPSMVGWVPLILALLGIYLGRRCHHMWYWLLSFGCYYLFQIAQASHFEARYFIISLPAICALVAWTTKDLSRFRSAVVYSFILLAIGWNVIRIFPIQQGLTGYEVVARQLAERQETGNIMTACWFDSDLIFRFRCQSSRCERQIIRGDRVLAIRLASYSGVPPENLVETPSEVIEILQQGRVRFLVTSPRGVAPKDERPADMIVAHQTASERPEDFTLLGQFPLNYSFHTNRVRKEQVCIWRYEGEFAQGKSELPVVIPTAGVLLNP